MNTAPSFDSFLKAYIEQIAFSVARHVVKEQRREIDDLIKSIAEQRNDLETVAGMVLESHAFEEAVTNAAFGLLHNSEFDKKVEAIASGIVSQNELSDDMIRQIVRDVINNDLVITADIE